VGDLFAGPLAGRAKAAERSLHEPARHRYYRRHWKLMAALLAVVLAADASIAILWLRPAILRERTDSAGRASWSTWQPSTFQASSVRIPKEIAAAILFTAGTFLTAWATLPCPSLAGPAWPSSCSVPGEHHRD
jgi:hypothetical protein